MAELSLKAFQEYARSTEDFGNPLRPVTGVVNTLFMRHRRLNSDMAAAGPLARDLAEAVSLLYAHLCWVNREAGLPHRETPHGRALLDALQHNAEAAVAEAAARAEASGDDDPMRAQREYGRVAAWEELLRLLTTLRGF